ncbi:phosphoglucomutase [Treponema sp. OMZ 788]|nr:phosphoglucomutase [Treponema sp. OMZ 788]UTC64873.1 phosphoglucomutase [Treponema sp. OMZ 788]
MRDTKDSISINNELSKMILSASGWRKVFAESGKEEDRTTGIKYADSIILCHAAMAFAEFLRLNFPKIKTIVIGRDSRPTGAAIEDVFIKTLILTSYNLKVVGCTAAPEIMAYSKTIGAAFAYISASHNPIGHNGLKFGVDSGGVLDGEQAKTLIKMFKERLNADNAEDAALKFLHDYNLKKLQDIRMQTVYVKKEALDAYYNYSKAVITNSSDPKVQDKFFDKLRKAVIAAKKEGHPLSIVADFNGSARAASIDRHFFKDSEFELIGVNEEPGNILHGILPEGANLGFCAKKMDYLHSDPDSSPLYKNSFLGYMPDCDGDRGNIIYWNEELNKAIPLEAQEVFTLSVIAELADSFYSKRGNKKQAVAVNGPTSLRVEEAAACFGAEVFRAEVGEANVVNLAAELREKKYNVRILGEGSNGGNITHPAKVRDPINTIFAILKLLLIKTELMKKGLFHIWCEKSKQMDKYKPDFTLADILKTLPQYTTTPTGEERAILKIHTEDHAVLKGRYQKIFEEEWNKKKEELKEKFGIVSYRSFSNNGTKQTQDLKDFSASGRGGLKIQFYNSKDEPIGFIWMRGSGTEPIFRIMADIKGPSPEDEKYLVEWQGEMVRRADLGA